MPESQNIEYKESWRDEFLKWICGFANAEGGKIYIGITDKGIVQGIANAKKLMEDIPNKVRDVLGILIETNLHSEEGKEYLEIVVEAYPYPINYKGQYHIRSGSTKQELKGNALNKFLLEKTGKRWDGVTLPNITIQELSPIALRLYREKASKTNRIVKEALEDSDEILLENLRLLESGKLKRAAILLFHPDPEKYFQGAYTKIGFFRTDDDLVYQDEVRGNLMEQVDKIYDLIITKYTTSAIEYLGTSRVEKELFPRLALREALLNALVHKDYSEAEPIQISVYPDHIVFWNAGQLPENWTADNLKRKHPSKPFNPDLAQALFRCGEIESWGRGTIKMIKESVAGKILPPEFNTEMSGMMVSFFSDAEEFLKRKELKKELIKVVLDTLEKGNTNNSRVRDICNVSKATATRYLTELDGEFLERVGKTGEGTYYIIKGS
ncbi:RNA-binding domain-containing protein [uncultured Roseivirga sp.]|uniref:RNA-binding domain-containing protein n=1 Tax=uncultured Roseivirga sp. TaxID=543088 RepID=UPI0030D6DF7A|tara:strand:- start:36303 stop:37619 length:1317 start_codon:yes stop_codon:yes gene_type:complete